MRHFPNSTLKSPLHAQRCLAHDIGKWWNWIKKMLHELLPSRIVAQLERGNIRPRKNLHFAAADANQNGFRLAEPGCVFSKRYACKIALNCTYHRVPHLLEGAESTQAGRRWWKTGGSRTKAPDRRPHHLMPSACGFVEYVVLRYGVLWCVTPNRLCDYTSETVYT